MGITGLLPFLKKIQRDFHVSALQGKAVGIDAYCWLHKGCYSCATQIVMKTTDIRTLPFVNYCLRRVNLLRQHDITPIMVFDGGYLPTKANTEKERRQKRQSYLAKGKELLKQGKKSDAHECFQKCVDITPEMALILIKECRKLNVQCIVAPYEADSQLAYLSKEGIVDTVITEDSDLLVFGSKQVLFKMDETGHGKMIELKDLSKASNNLIGFTEDTFRQMCILSGCDYLPSVPGIGLGKATKLMRKHHWNPTQVIRALRCENSKVPSDYETNFMKAEYTFLYQLVFDPRSQKQVHLNDIPDTIDNPKEFEFVGVEHSPRKAVHMARGNINPITMEVMDMYSPSKTPQAPPPSSKSSSWACSAMGSANKQYPMSIQARLPIQTSARLSKPFKPPAATAAKPGKYGMVDVDGALRDDEIVRLYSGGSSVGDENEQVEGHEPLKPSLSKYFASERNAVSPCSFTETESGWCEPLEASTDDGAAVSSSSPAHVASSPDRVMETPVNADTTSQQKSHALAQLSSSSSSSPPLPSSLSVSCPPKRKLFSTASSKLSRFAFIKRRKSDTTDVLVPSTTPMHAGVNNTRPVKKNPFAVPSQQPAEDEVSDDERSETTCTMDCDAPTAFCSSLSSSDSTFDPSSANELPASRSFSRSSSVATSQEATCDQLMPQRESLSRSATESFVTESFAQRESADESFDACSVTACGDGVERTPQYVADSLDFNEREPLSPLPPQRNRSWCFGQHSKSFSANPISSSSQTKRRRQTTGACKSVGLSKKVKPPRLSDTSQTRLQFSSYSYKKKPQMKL